MPIVLEPARRRRLALPVLRAAGRLERLARGENSPNRCFLRNARRNAFERPAMAYSKWSSRATLADVVPDSTPLT